MPVKHEDQTLIYCTDEPIDPKKITGEGNMSIEELAANVDWPLEGKITLNFKLVGAHSDDQFHHGGVSLEVTPKFEGYSKDPSEFIKMLRDPRTFANGGPIVSLAAVLVLNLLKQDGTIESSMKAHEELTEQCAQHVSALSAIDELLEIANLMAAKDGGHA